MNWCYYFIDLQQKAIFSKSWGGPEKDRFFGFFGFFIFFGFFQSLFVFMGSLFFLLSSPYSLFFSSLLSSPSMVVPLPLRPLPPLPPLLKTIPLPLPLWFVVTVSSLVSSFPAAVVIPPICPRPMPHVAMVALPPPALPLRLTSLLPRRR